MSSALSPLAPAQLALTGATGRVATLLRPWMAEALWLDRHDDLSVIRGRDALIALAGVTSGSEADLAANTDTALAALDAAASAGVPHVLLLSSAAVYGSRTGPLRAQDAPTPATPYGTAKAEMERAVTEWCADRQGGPRATILRLGNVAGADALLGRLAPGAVPDLHIWPDGRSPRRSYIGPKSLAHVLCALAARHDLPPVINIGTPDLVEMADLLRAAGHTWTPVPAPPQAIAEVALDTAPLAAFVTLPDDAGTPEGLVRDWQEAIA